FAVPINVENAPNAKENPKEKEWIEDHVFEIAIKLRTIGAPDAAFPDFLKNRLHYRALSEDFARRAAQFGRKWNIPLIAEMDFETVKSLVLEPPTNTAAEIEQAWNQNIVSLEDKLREQKYEEIPEEAVDEFFAEGFHLFPFNDEKFERAEQFFKKWDISKEKFAGYLKTS
ncbi:hypothetical protein PMAYCL1PPCAC_09469, partial [Pristionchus mayeri]